MTGTLGDHGPLTGIAALPPGIDHLIYTAPELETGVAEMERLTGVPAVRGGRHPSFGTHNALLSLGSETYLEIIAPDPESVRPARGLLFSMDDLPEPRLATWVLRSESIEDQVAAAAAAGLDLGEIGSGGRRRPDGAVLTWRLTDPYAMPLGGAVPFLISWGDTPNPAAAAPSAGRLVGLRLEHPEPRRVRAALAALAVEMRVSEAESVRLVATISTGAGEVEVA